MRRFVALGYRSKQLQSLNRCRLFLRVTTLADIVESSGRYLCQQALQGRRQIGRPSYGYTWPEQGNPDKEAWKLWAKAIRQAVGITNFRSTECSTALGPWTDNDETWEKKIVTDSVGAKEA